ncbi:hypothetical protein BH24GEM1_BH24GEM1_16490 [soil metagenome]
MIRRLNEVGVFMIISASRTKTGPGLLLRTRRGREAGPGDYDQTIRPGESALGFTYEEWDAAVGPQPESRIELAEDGTLRRMPAEHHL